MELGAARELHLHTLESLLAQLIGGGSVLIGRKEFGIPDLPTRSVLDWYRSRGQRVWVANISVAQCEEIVASLSNPPLANKSENIAAIGSRKRLTLRRVVAHRFAGIHKYGTPNNPPDDYQHDFSDSLTLFEGRNGSGKTSLLNAIVWALRGGPG